MQLIKSESLPLNFNLSPKGVYKKRQYLEMNICSLAIVETKIVIPHIIATPDDPKLGAS